MEDHAIRPPPGASPELTDAWHEHRRRLLDVAYRMLGSVGDAEDVVQEAYVRLLRAGTGEIDDIGGWLVTVTGRLCLDQLRSARVRRTRYAGPWLPEPLVELRVSGPTDPADRVTLDDSVRMALLVVLEQLTPAERTAFVLHDVFRVPFETIGSIVGRSAASCRQLASRARHRVRSTPDVARFAAGRDVQQRVAERFVRACASGRIEDLVEVLDPDAAGEFDSGGVIPGAPTRAIHGAEPIARVIVRSFAGAGAVFSVAGVNGEPGMVVRAGERIVAVAALTTRGDRVEHIHAIGNPAKLAHLNRPGSH